MNPLLQEKLNDLAQVNKYECWYLVKQTTKFEIICRLVSFLKDYKSNSMSDNLSDFINNKIDDLKIIGADIPKNYRALRVAAFFGLIKMTTTDYKYAIITDTFEEINKRCSGHFEQTVLYIDIIQRQIERCLLALKSMNVVMI